MTFQSVDPLKNTGALLDLISKKQKVIGENLANLDTPGYVRKDLDFAQYLGHSASPLETELASRFGPPPVFEQKSQAAINPADELMELQKNSLLYSMATRRMSSIITEMRTVVNVGK